MNHISLNGEVVAQKLGSISVVGHDAAHFGRRQEYVLRPFRSEERRNRALVGQVQLGTTAQQQIARALPLKTTNQGGPARPRWPATKMRADKSTRPTPGTKVSRSRRPAPGASRCAVFRSARTISLTISSKVIAGVQPSFSRALVGSPSNVSTSAGRK